MYLEYDPLNRQTHAHTHKQTDRQTDRYTHTHYAPCSSSLAFFSGGNLSKGSSSGQNVGSRFEESGGGEERLLKSWRSRESNEIGGVGGMGGLGGVDGVVTLGSLDMVTGTPVDPGAGASKR